MKVCTNTDCEREVKAKGLCKKHYQVEYRARRKNRDYNDLGHGKETTYQAGCRCEQCAFVRKVNTATWFANNRARKYGCEGHLRQKDVRELFERYTECLSCGTPDELCIDHIVALSTKGPNTIDNCQVLCQTCNGIKYNKEIDYRRQVA